MCSVSFSASNFHYNPNFTSQKKQNQVNYADGFIKELEK